MRQNTRRLSAMAGLAAASLAAATPIDFNTFEEWFDGVYPLSGTFAAPNWEVRDGGLTVTNPGNSTVSAFVDPTLEMNGQRITGFMDCGDDDDGVGFVFGYTRDDSFNPDADFLYLDWKGVDQGFDFIDIPENAGFFNDLTGPSDMLAGIRVARVRGLPNADEFWGAVNFPQNDDPAYLALGGLPGGVTELARAIDLGRVPYPRINGRLFKFDIDLTPTNLKVWVNGSLQFNIDAPADKPFETTGFGVLEQYQDSGNNRDQGLWTAFEINPTPGTTPSGDGIADILPPPFIGRDGPAAFTAGRFQLVENNLWATIESTVNSRFMNTQGPNAGDAEFRATTGFVDATTGVVMATRSLNQTGVVSNHVAVVTRSAFGGTGETSVAVNRAIGNAENQVPFDAVYFPYAEGYIGGRYDFDADLVLDPNSLFSGSPVVATATQVLTPREDDADGVLFNATVPTYGAIVDLDIQFGSPSAGLLFVVAGSNSNNTAGAIPHGSDWRVMTRDGGDAINASADGGEVSDFGFVFLRPSDSATVPVAARVLANGSKALSWGSSTVTRTQAGLYRLSIPGESPRSGALILSSAQAIAIEDPNGTVPDPDQVPANDFVSFQPDGDTWLIQVVETGGVNLPRDGAFHFAFVSFGGVTANPGCNPADLVSPFGQLDIFDIVAYFNFFASGC